MWTDSQIIGRTNGCDEVNIRFSQFCELVLEKEAFIWRPHPSFLTVRLFEA